MAVRIRMKMMGRKHRPYFRIVAIDHRQPRDGRIIEELGSYDPMVKDTNERVRLKPERIKMMTGLGKMGAFQPGANMLKTKIGTGHRKSAKERAEDRKKKRKQDKRGKRKKDDRNPDQR